MPEARTYLDYNATAPLRPEARAAIVDVLERVGNPSSVHAEGRWARGVVENAREAVAALVEARPGEVVFTSGGTEANALALRGSGRPRIVVGALEHPSVLVHCTATIPATADGVVEVERFEAVPEGSAGDAVFSLMIANNETGVLQPVERVSEAARRAGALSHTDAIQGGGKLLIDFRKLGVDLLTLSGHKLGGPAGVGALVVRDGVDLEPLLRGGGQERRRRAGTENLAGIAGFGAAANAALSAQASEATRLAALRDRLEAVLREAAPDVTIHGAESARLPNTSCIGLPDARAEMQVMSLDLAGVAVSAGSACSSGKVAPSHVLGAMGVPEDVAGAAIRVSLGWATTDADIDRFVAAWSTMARRCGGLAA